MNWFDMGASVVEVYSVLVGVNVSSKVGDTIVFPSSSFLSFGSVAE